MDIGQLIGIIFALAVVIYSIVSAILELFYPGKKREIKPESESIELDEDEEEEEEERSRRRVQPRRPLPPPPPHQLAPVRHKVPLRETTEADEKFIFHSKLENFRRKTAIEDRKLTIHLRPTDQLVSEDMRHELGDGVFRKKKKSSPIRDMVRGVAKRNSLLVAYEIINVPVGFRRSPFPRDV